MRTYLESELVLSGDNSLFDDWDLPLRQKHATGKDGKAVVITAETDRATYYLPIIPVVTESAAPLPKWPVGMLNPDSLKESVVGRIEAVLNKLRGDNLPGFLASLAGVVVVPGVAHYLGAMLIDKLRTDLGNAGL